jgi:hypothetical protein
MAQAKGLDIWIRQVVFGDKPVAKLVLRHLPLGSKQGQEVCAFDVPNGEVSPLWLSDTRQSIEMQAQSDADGIGGTQHYILQAVDSDGATLTRKAFRVQGDDPDVGGEISSEPATKGGLLAQTMRHLEAVMRTSTISTESIMKHMARTIDRLAEQNESLQEQRSEVFEMLEQLTSAAHERQIASKNAESRNAAMMEAAKSLKVLVPLIASKISGQKMLGDGSQGQAISAVMDSIKQDPERLASLVQLLKPEEQAVLFELMQEGPTQ